MILVTGGFGFIGSNVVKGLNDAGHSDVLVVDNLTNGTKFKNLVNCFIADYVDKNDFLDLLNKNLIPSLTAIFHLGACSTTTEWNGQYMMRNNYEFSKQLFHYALRHDIPFIYASSAAVYGNSTTFSEELVNEAPLNVYGYSKWLFDQYVRAHWAKNEKMRVAGLRFFNVYGPHEEHKGSMASVAYHFFHQIQKEGILKLFAGYDGYGDGEQRRDFVYVNDVVNVCLWLKNILATNHYTSAAGIFNVGTGHSQTFNEVAQTVIETMQRGKIEYIPFPDHLKGRYQSFTEADLSRLRQAGYQTAFAKVQEGVKAYTQFLLETSN